MRRDKNDIGAKAHGGQVSITAEVKREHRKQQGPREIFTERSSGQVYRSFTLPGKMSEKATASYENSLLTLELPKKHHGGAVS